MNAAVPTPAVGAVASLAGRGVYVRERLRAYGIAGLVGVLALLGAMALYLFSYRPQQAALLELEQQLAQQPGAQQATSLPRMTARGHGGELPGRGQLPALLGTIVQQAERAGVSLERGTYGFASQRGGRVLRYQLTFPIKAGYPQLRKFLDFTLAALPAAGIDTLSIERKSIGEPLVDANVTFFVMARGQR